MALVKCPDCGNDVSDLAPTCPKCGRPIKGALETSQAAPVTSSATQQTPASVPPPTDRNPQTASSTTEKPKIKPNYLQLLLGLLGSLAIAIGVFMPLLKPTGMGFVNLFANGSMFGLNMLFWGLIALGFVACRRFKETAIPSVVVLGLTIYLYIMISSQEGASRFEYGFAWALFVGGAIALLVAAVLPSKWGTKPPVVFVALAILNAVFSFFSIKSITQYRDDTSSRTGRTPSAQSALGIDTNVFEGDVTLVSITAENIPMRNNSGDGWDTFHPEPDPFLEIRMDGDLIDRTTTASECTGEASWTIGEEIYITSTSSLTFDMWDEDVNYHDHMCSATIDCDRLTWGENSFEYDNGMTLVLEFR